MSREIIEENAHSAATPSTRTNEGIFTKKEGKGDEIGGQTRDPLVKVSPRKDAARKTLGS